MGEEFKRNPETEQEKVSKVLDVVAYGELDEKEMDKAKDKAVPFANKLNTHEYLKDAELPDYLPRKGSEIETGKRFSEEKMSVFAAAKLLKTKLGDKYSVFHLNYLKQH